jgi:hypothetical protein
MKRRIISQTLADYDKLHLKTRSPLQVLAQELPAYSHSKKDVKNKGQITSVTSSTSIRSRTSTPLEPNPKEKKTTTVNEGIILDGGMISDIFLADLMSLSGFPEDSLKMTRGLLTSKTEKIIKGDSCYPQEDEIALYLKTFQCVIRKKLSSRRSLEKWYQNELNSPRIGKVKEYMKKIESEITTLCNEAITFADELETLPFLNLKPNLNSRLLVQQLKASSFRYLAKIQSDSNHNEMIQKSSDLYNSALCLARDNLTPHHHLLLQLSLDTANIYVKHLKQFKMARDIANKTFDDAINTMSDITSSPSTYEGALSLLQKIRDLIGKIPIQ